MADMFKKAAFTLEGLEWSLKEKERKVDWSNKDAVAQYRQDCRSLVKSRMMPKDLICPMCRVKKIEPSRWSTDGRQCIKCLKRPERADEPMCVQITLFTLAEERWKVEKLRRLSITDAASMMGVSYGSWYRYHSRSAKTMTKQWYEKLVAADMFVSSPRVAHMYEMTDELGRLRKTVCSANAFASLCGWSVARQAYLESHAQRVGHDIRTKILQTLEYVGIKTLDE